MKINIVISEPRDENEGGVGAFEWRVDAAEAEREFRSLRSRGSVTRLWLGVEAPKFMSPEEITEWVDVIYWDGGLQAQLNTFGEPARVHGLV